MNLREASELVISGYDIYIRDGNFDFVFSAIDTLRSALELEAEPQEPVGYIDSDLNLRMGKPRKPGPLYAHPAPAPMPDWEILKIGDSCLKYESNARDDSVIAFARAVRGEA